MPLRGLSAPPRRRDETRRTLHSEMILSGTDDRRKGLDLGRKKKDERVFLVLSGDFFLNCSAPSFGLSLIFSHRRPTPQRLQWPLLPPPHYASSTASPRTKIVVVVVGVISRYSSQVVLFTFFIVSVSVVVFCSG